MKAKTKQQLRDEIKELNKKLETVSVRLELAIIAIKEYENYYILPKLYKLSNNSNNAQNNSSQSK